MATKKTYNNITYSLKLYGNLNGNYTRISNDVYKLTTGNEFKVYSYLCHRYNSENEYAFPSINTIAIDCNMSQKTIQRCIKQLEQIGLIKILKFTEKTVQYANNCYRVYYPIIIKDSLEDERGKELQKIMEEADNEVIDKIRTIEISSELYNSDNNEQ